MRSGVRIIRVFKPVAVVIDLQEEMGKNRVADYYALSTGPEFDDVLLVASQSSVGTFIIFFWLVTRFHTI